MRATIRIPEDELVYEPGVLICRMAAAELTLINDDKNTHCAVLPSNGDYPVHRVENHSKGQATLELDGPGHDRYGSTLGNDEGRGLTAAIVVGTARRHQRLASTAGHSPPLIDRPAHPEKRSTRMATEYVDAGKPVTTDPEPAVIGYAPPVAKGVNLERILNARAEPQNWLTYYGAYDGQRYSPLDQINAEHRQEAQAAVGVPGRLGGPAFGRFDVLVRGLPDRRGRDHVRLGLGRPVWALDAGNGHCCGSYKHASPFDVSLCCGNVNRGVAVAEGKVFMATLNAQSSRSTPRPGRRSGISRSATCGPARAPRSLP